MSEEIVKTIETPLGNIFILKQEREATEDELYTFYKKMADLIHNTQ